MKKLSFLFLLIPIISVSQPISNGLVGYWNFDNNVFDQSPYANHGSVNGTLLPTTDRNNIPNSCYDFQLNQHIDMGDPSEYDFGSQEFTISIWTNRAKQNLNNDHNFLIGKYNVGSQPGTNEWALTSGLKNVGHFPHFAVEIGTTYYGITSNTELNVNQWHHILAIRKSTSLELYIDGKNVGSLTIPNSAINNVPGMTLKFGKYSSVSYLDDGKIDETMIFNRALSESEIDVLAESYKKKQVYSVSESSEIEKMSLNEGDIIFTNTGAKYLIQNDSIIDYEIDDCVVIETYNSKYAIMQTRDGGFYVEDFGAIANDGLDDRAAIQKCIDAAIKLKYVTSKVNLGPGQFDLDTGLVIARWYEYNDLTNKELGVVTLNLSGNIPVNGNNPVVGSTTVLNLKTSSFSLAIQMARNSVIENIFFIGKATDYQKFTRRKLIENELDDWGSNIGIRTERYSPDCAIAIDPFHIDVPDSARYSGFSKFYENGYTNIGESIKGGSSMLLIRGCGFRYHYIGIANNPSNKIQNGDNIRVENSRATQLFAFWATGQDQSRGNSINNIYGTSINRFVDCSSIGNGFGTPPNITNCNLAGGIKELIHMEVSGRSHVRVSNIYAESLLSLGYINANNVSFHQCQFKFMGSVEGDTMYTSPYHLFVNGGIASFADCNLEYYNGSAGIRPPFRMYAKGLNIIGGYIEGGVVSNGIFGNGLNPVNFQNVQYYNYTSTIGSHLNGELGGNLYKLNGQIMIGGDEFKAYAGNDRHVFENKNPVYNYKGFGLNKIYQDVDKEGAYFIPSNTGQFQIGDNIVTDNLMDIENNVLYYPPVSGNFRNTIGYVSEISNDTVFIADVPYGITFDMADKFVHTIDYPIFFAPFWGKITNGSNVITGVNLSLGYGWDKLEYRKINGNGILTGTYITDVNDSLNTITISTNATQTDTSVYFNNAVLKQTVYREVSTIPTSSVPYITGSQIYLDPVAPTVYGYHVVKGGIPGTIHTPSFKALDY